MTVDRRTFLKRAACGAFAASAALTGRGADPAPAEVSADSRTRTAVERGLAFLASVQGNDGSFSDSRFRNIAVTGLAGLAFMAGGHQPYRGKYGPKVARAVDFLLAQAPGTPEGYLRVSADATSHDGMYQHGFGTLFLSEVCGMFPDTDRKRRVRDHLEKAVALIARSQNGEGGWRYDPEPRQADISVTVAQLMALRAARNAGVVVAKGVIDRCVKYIEGCRQPDGGFSYFKGHGVGGSQFPRSAAAIVGLYSAGVYDGPMIESGLKYLARFLPGRRALGPDVANEHYYYAQYYAALAMWTAGGDHWTRWYPAIRDELIEKLGTSTNWTDYYGAAYATAMACIILQLPENCLPIMQK